MSNGIKGFGRPAVRRVALLGCFVAAFVAAPAARAQVTEESTDVESASLSFGLDTEIGILSFENEFGDGERFLSSVLAPTFERGKLSGGLRFTFRWNQEGLRDEDYDENTDYLAIIRFVQYSDKYEPGAHLRLGDIDESQLGFGQFVNQYRNTLSLDDPKTGLILDHRGSHFRLESVYSNFGNPEIYGVRAAVLPFKGDTTRVNQSMVFGVTLAGDVSEDARLVSEKGNGLPFFEGDVPAEAAALGLGSARKASPLTMLGFDLGVPAHIKGLDELLVYAEVGNIFGFGSGLGLGLEAEHLFGRLRVRSWFEQRLLGKHYVPSYFNSRYEHDRLRSATVTLADGTELEAVNSKRNELNRRDEVDVGSYVGMEFRLTRHYRLRWSLEHSWTREQSGWFELDLRMSDPDVPIQIRYVFDRVNMDGIRDIVEGSSNNALHRLEVAYLVWKHALVGIRYRESFETVESLGRTIGHRKRARLEPAIIIRI